jgi:hypothetical protein
MMAWWGRIRRELDYQADLVMTTPSKSHQLAALASDAERAELCRAWATEARLQWYQGQAEMIADMCRSRDLRYVHMDAATRKRIGAMKWIDTAKQRSLSDQDQMYTRWAQEYQGAANGSYAAQGVPSAMGRREVWTLQPPDIA